MTATYQREREEFADHLNSKPFTHFITLASNRSFLSDNRMRDLLREWDARVNRRLFGPKWRKHYDELTWWYGFLEKPVSNPHWHILMDLRDHDKAAKLPEASQRAWEKLVPGGTVVVRTINLGKDKLTSYVVKEVGHGLQYANFVAPDEFRRFGIYKP